jgi:cytoskeletal protein CcmA (bactofilin family)
MTLETSRGQQCMSLNSKGSLIIGKKGKLIGNVKHMKEVVIEGGCIVGNIQVDKVTIRSKGSVHGDITAKTIKVEPGCNIIGTLNINPHAPDSMNLKGEVVKVAAVASEKKENKVAVKKETKHTTDDTEDKDEEVDEE